MKNINEKNNGKSVMISVFNNGYMISLLLFLAGSAGSFCDGIIASRCLGVAELAAIGLAYPYFKCMEFLSLVFSGGAQVAIGRRLGQNRSEEVSSVFLTAFISLTFLGIFLFSLVTGFAAPLSVLFGAGGAVETLTPTMEYLRSVAVCTPAYLLTLFLIPLLQLDGKKKLVNLSTVIMTITNVLLNILFLVQGMGIKGIGYSTSISYYCALFVLATHFFDGRKGILLSGKCRISEGNLAEICREGMPSACKSITSIVYNIAINNIIAMTGSTAGLAAFSAYKMTKFLFLSVTESVMSPVRLIQSMLFEEKDRNALKSIFRYSVLKGLILSSLISVFLWISGKQFYSIFVSGVILDETVCLIRCETVAIVFNTFVCYYLSYFQAIGKKKITYSISFVLNICSVPVTYLFAAWLGVRGVWTSIAVMHVITSVYAAACACILGRRNRRFADRLLALPAEQEEISLMEDYHIGSADDTRNVFSAFSCVCRDNIADRKKAYFCNLALEEIVCNILSFQKSVHEKNINIDIHIILYTNGKFIMRVKDCSEERNPFAKYEYRETEDDFENLGVRMVKSFAEEIKYAYIFGMNYLVIKV